MKWSGVRRGGGEVGVAGEPRDVAGIVEHDGHGVLVEPLRPVVAGFTHRPTDLAQVVDDVAAADDQHPVPAQRRQPRAQFEVVVPGLGRVDGQLHHRDVGRGEHMRQDRPGSVVEAPGVEVLAHPPRLTTSATCSASSGRPGAGPY